MFSFLCVIDCSAQQRSVVNRIVTKAPITKNEMIYKAPIFKFTRLDYAQKDGGESPRNFRRAFGIKIICSSLGAADIFQFAYDIAPAKSTGFSINGGSHRLWKRQK